MVENDYQNSVQIPVRVRDGAVELLYGGALPTLQEGTVGTLTVPAHAFLDQEMLNQLSRGLTVPRLSAGTELLALMKTHRNDPQLIKQKEGGIRTTEEGSFAQIILLDDLDVRLRGSKRATLGTCRCNMPALPDKLARSVNHAYTMLSEHFERDRISHTGNVFELVYFRRGAKNEWLPLDALRRPMEAAIEQRVISLANQRAGVTK